MVMYNFATLQKKKGGKGLSPPSTGSDAYGYLFYQQLEIEG